MKKRRFNWLDGLCILLALALLAGGVWYFLANRYLLPDDLEPKQYDITLRFTRTTTDPNDFYAVGDTLYFLGGETEIGTVTALEPTPFIREEYDEETGTYVVFNDPKDEQITMTVRAEGVVDTEKNVFTVNESGLSVGMTFYPQSRKTRSTMTVLSIEEVAE